MIWPTYQEWSDAVVSIETREQADMVMDVYILPNGDHIRHDSIMPRHWGRKSYTRTLLCSIQLPKGTILPHGGELWDSYTDNTMGVPVWNDGDVCEDSLKAAYEWMMTRSITRP